MPASTDYEAFGPLIAQVNRRWRKALDDCLSPLGLTEATWRPLLYINRAGEPLSQNDLADLLSLDRSSVVRLLDTLEASNLVFREEDPGDRRVKRLHLTSAGKTIAGHAERASQQLRESVFSAIPHDLLATTRMGLLEIHRLLDKPKSQLDQQDDVN